MRWMINLAAWLAGVLPAPARRAFYRFPPIARWIRRSLNLAAPQGITVVEIAAGGLAGARLALDLQSEKDYWLGTYETDLQAVLERVVRPGMVAYDVGANIGYISLLLARAAGETGRVFAFEALPENQERLQANLALNDFGRRVELIPAAVTGGEGPVEFLVGPSGGMGKAAGSAGREDIPYERRITVSGLSLDDFVYRQDHPAPDLVKMDIEGGEVMALPGMARLLAEARPWMLLELHGPQAAQAAWGGLTAAGYRLGRMQPGFPPVKRLEDLDWKAYVVGCPPEL